MTAPLVGLSSRALLTAADELLTQPHHAWEGRWPRAVALLTRQALERSMEELYHAKRPELMSASARAQLLCLPVWLSPDLAGRAAWTYSALGRACHHHAYDVAPTAMELANWLETADELSRTVAGRVATTRHGRSPG